MSTANTEGSGEPNNLGDGAAAAPPASASTLPSLAPPAPLGPFFRAWVRIRQGIRAGRGVTVLEEACAKHERPFAVMRSVLIDHHVRLAVVERMGYQRAAAVVRNRLAESARIRSGDLGEILATEYVDEMTEFKVPIRRLRHRDDRTVAMRGDDVIGIALDAARPPRILKVESKSREVVSATVIAEAGDALAKHSGRPNPSTLSFISTKLRDDGRDDLAEVFEDLQAGRLTERSVAHLIFVLSGNDPSTAFDKHRASPFPAIARTLVGLVVDDHQDFIRQLYESV